LVVKRVHESLTKGHGTDGRSVSTLKRKRKPDESKVLGQ
jgi:hypothetical protein